MIPADIVDAHVHFWHPDRFRYPWLDEVPALNRPHLPADFAAACAGANVGKMIFVECGRVAAQALAEADWVSALAQSDPRLGGIVAHAPLEIGLPVRAGLQELAARPLVKAVRRLLQSEPDADFCLREEFVAGVRLLAEFNFTFDLCVRHEQLRAVTELVRRVPEVTFVLDHFGKSPVRQGKLEPWAAALRALAELPNVCCKLSGLTTEADWKSWQPEILRPYFQVALEAFGFDRLLFGGDWPVSTLATDYQRWVETVVELTSGGSPAEQARLMSLNAQRVYRLKECL